MRLQIKDGDHVDRGYILYIVPFCVNVLYFKSIILSMRYVPGQRDPRIIHVNRVDRSDRFGI